MDMIRERTVSLRVDSAALAGGAAADLVVTGIGELCSLDEPAAPAGPRRGEHLEALGIVRGGAIACGGGRILATGPEDEVLAAAPCGDATVRVDALGRCVVPGFVDPHTHAVFGRTRQDEYERRLRGESYLQIAAAGGGINASVADLRSRDEQDLLGLTCRRLQEMLEHGTTTVEIKSGYGLTHDDELKMLQVGGQAARTVGMRSVLTCLAAHEIPPEYRERRAEYVRLINEVILPDVAARRYAERVDVFCEPSVFDLEETESLIRRGMELGMRATVHADELEPFGGAALAARLGADSADHLIRIDEAGIAALAASDTVAVLLPGTVFSLGLESYAPAARMIEAGVAVALATDFNPGSCPILSMPLVMAIACTQMKMSPAAALTGCTLNSAWALGLADEVGSLAPGKAADFVVLDGDDHRLVPYHAGHNPVHAVYRDGRFVV